MSHYMIFPPGAHPTYIPAGMAYLLSHCSQEGVDLKAIDINIELWHSLIQQKPEERMILDFFQGKQGDFYNGEQYLLWKKELGSLYADIDELYKEVTKYLDSNIEGELTQKLLRPIAEDISSKNPETLSFSVLYNKQLPFALAIAKMVFEQRDIHIYLGGASISSTHPEEILTGAPWIKALFRGEGERGLVSILKGEPFASIKGISYRDNEEIIHRGKPETLKLRSDFIPDFSFTDLSKYFNPLTVLPILFSRGCRWRRCSFCSHNFSFSGYRSKHYEDFVEELSILQNRYGVKHFYFADQYISAKDLEGIAQGISKRGLQIFFHVMGRPTDDYTPELLKQLYSAGCRWISWGVESGSQALLDACQKGTEVGKVAQVLKDSAAAGISNLSMMIFGLPGTSQQSLDETISFASDVSPSVSAFTSSSFQLFEGTPFFKEHNRFNLIPLEKEVMFNLSNQQIHSLRREYRIRSGDGSAPAPGSAELHQWERWKMWVRGGATLWEQLFCEHYLLFAGQESSQNGGLRPSFTRLPLGSVKDSA